MGKSILTRKAYREHMEEGLVEKVEDWLEEDDFSTKPVEERRPKAPFLARYNRFLNRWLLGLGLVFFICVLCQIFL